MTQHLSREPVQLSIRYPSEGASVDMTTKLVVFFLNLDLKRNKETQSLLFTRMSQSENKNSYFL